MTCKMQYLINVLRLHKRNYLETSNIAISILISVFFLLYYFTNISPITGIWFHLYILILFIVSLCLNFKYIPYLLRLNKPLTFDIEQFGDEIQILSVLPRLLPWMVKRPRNTECREYDTNELSVISTVLERKLVSSWYVPYISQEIGFPFACKQMLDQMIGKSFQICNKIETKDVFVDVSIVLASHLKEYRKAMKRHEKTPNIPVESLYKKTHPIYEVANKTNSADHCTNILRIVFKELVPWELWDTPYSELLVRILAKKLDHFIDITLSEPKWLNYKLMSILKKKVELLEKDHDIKLTKDKETEKMEEVSKESEQAGLKVEPNVKVAETVTPVVPKSTMPVSHPSVVEETVEKPAVEKIENIVEEVPVNSTEPVDIKTSPVLRQRRGRQGRNEVKIYDRIIEGSVKTWETDIDLQCISLGQDLLASLDGEITLSRLWGQEPDIDGSPNPPRGKSPQPLWFGEEETIEIDPIDSSPHKEPKKEQSPKATDALLKDLQTTVSQAKTKIGDLQVDHMIALDVPCKQSSNDEAAGMMEGLLDFGIAGLKKGLRFTGLSDDSQEKSPSHRERSSDKTPPSETARGKHIPEHKDTHANGQKDDNNVPPLVKQQRVISQDSVPSQAKPIARAEPLPIPLGDSPEPEYEEAADLSTSIAKLRCLLQQRAETSPRTERNEEVWWESAEETRGRTQQHTNYRHVDTATLADEYDMNMERNSSPGQTSNNMQRLDKLFHRTVTGVFNSIKTAVGAEDDTPAHRTLHDWTYVCTSVDFSVCGAVGRLVGSRRAFTHVEAALDSLDQIPPPTPRRPNTPDDFEEWCGGAGSCCGGVGALLAASGFMTSHTAHKLATVILGDLLENLLESWLDELTSWLRQQIFITFEELSKQDGVNTTEPGVELPDVDVDQTATCVHINVREWLYVFGEKSLSEAISLVVNSFNHKEVNKDIIFRVLDLIAGHFKKSAGLRNPSFDNS